MKAERRVMRLVVLLVMLLAMLALPLVTYAAPPPDGWRVVHAPAGLRLRDAPSLSGAVILMLWNGERVQLLSAPVWADGISWSYVQTYRSGYYIDGYCATAYLGGGSGPGPAHGMKVVAPAGLRLRSGPGTGYAVLAVAPYGTLLGSTGVVQWSGGIRWLRVNYGGLLYWAASAYLVAV
jgi:hypothetical protein